MERLLCVAKALSTPDSLVCLRLFLRAFFAQTSAEVSPFAQAHQVLERRVGNVLACVMSAEGRGWWGWQRSASSYTPFPLDRQITACC